MASALLGLSSSNKLRHAREYPVHSSEASVHKMTVMQLQEPVVTLVLYIVPVPEQLVGISLFLFLFIPGIGYFGQFSLLG